MVGLLTRSSPAIAAEQQIKPFIAVTFGGKTTFVDLGHAAGKPHPVIGIGAAFLGDLIGLDIDVARVPGFFQSGEQDLVLSSSVTTVTGNIILTLPRRMTEYTLRPYFVGGAGLMRARSRDYFRVLTVSDTLAAMDVGGGATGFVTDRVGVSWEARHFRSFGRDRDVRGVSFAPGQLSFWRASMALVYRY